MPPASAQSHYNPRIILDQTGLLMLRRTLGLCLLAALAGCATADTKRSLLDETVLSYAAVIRWGNFEEALGFVDPETLKAHPLTKLDLDRYLQVRVTGYNEQPIHPSGKNEARQTVEISIVNNNTQSLRSFLDRQLWRYDEKAKRWWLVTGLPDITQH
jgi:hypothetical protein